MTLVFGSLFVPNALITDILQLFALPLLDAPSMLNLTLNNAARYREYHINTGAAIALEST
jgi:hypothetical protein